MRRKQVVRSRLGQPAVRWRARVVEFTYEGKVQRVKLDGHEVEALNEMAGSLMWHRPKDLGGAPSRISPSLNKLAAKGLLERRDMHGGLWNRATWDYRANGAGDAALVAAREMGWRPVGGWPT